MFHACSMHGTCMLHATCLWLQLNFIFYHYSIIGEAQSYPSISGTLHVNVDIVRVSTVGSHSPVEITVLSIAIPRSAEGQRKRRGWCLKNNIIINYNIALVKCAHLVSRWTLGGLKCNKRETDVIYSVNNMPAKY